MSSACQTSTDAVVAHMRDYWSVEKYDRLAELRAQIAEADKALRQVKIFIGLPVHLVRQTALNWVHDMYPNLSSYRLEIFTTRSGQHIDHLKLKPAF